MKSPEVNESILYVVFFETEKDPREIAKELSMIKLQFGLYLVRSDKTQSQLYHTVKHAVQPETLFVGALEQAPKFKGMEAGTLKWLRSSI